VPDPQPDRAPVVSRRQHYYDLTVVYCMLLIVLAQMPWPADTWRRVGIDVTGIVLAALAILSFVQVRRARAEERRGQQ